VLQPPDAEVVVSAREPPDAEAVVGASSERIAGWLRQWWARAARGPQTTRGPRAADGEVRAARGQRST
jgi:hypothetical protein